MQLYSTLAPYYSILNPNGVYDTEVWHYMNVFEQKLGSIQKIIEFGSGVGAFAESLPTHLKVTLVDLSQDMLFESQKRNPNKKHVCSDIRNVSIEQIDDLVDVVFLHDAVMYLTTEDDLYKTFQSAKKCLRNGGILLVVPDVFEEDFEEHFLAGGEDGFVENQHVSVRLTEWHWRNLEDPNRIFVEFSLMIRHENQPVQHVHETHVMGLFSQEQYIQHLQKAGFTDIEIREDGIWAQ